MPKPLIPTILSLCDGTGAWAEPYREAGYTIFPIDIKAGQDIRLLDALSNIHGVLAAPPCTHLSASGARWWEGKGVSALLEALSIVDACLRIVLVVKPVWWCLENPVGRLSTYLGPPVLTFQPYEFGDPYSKRTCLWGNFNTELKKTPVEPTDKDRIWRIGPSPDRGTVRSITPTGFAKAFFEANP